MATLKLTEKPAGARGVSKWEIHSVRDYSPYWRLGQKDPYLFDPQQLRVQIAVDFYDAEAATEFESKIRAMMPES